VCKGNPGSASSPLGVRTPNPRRRAELTFRFFQALDVGAQLVNRLDILILFHTIKHDPTSRLQVRHTTLERHRPNRDTRVHRVAREIEMTDRTGVRAPAFLLQIRDELDCSDLGRARDGTGGEDGSERVESGKA
jgi:hypothetical protein